MLRIAGAAVLCVLCCVVGVAADARNLIDVVSSHPELTRFVHLLQRTRLLPTLNRMQELSGPEGGMTIFAPNNAAFERAMQGSTNVSQFWRDAFAERPPDNVHAALRQQLWYHILNYTLDAQQDGLVYHETLHFPSRKRLQEPTRPGPVPQPPSEPPHPGAEDEGGLLGGYGQLLRVFRKSREMRVGVDEQGSKGSKAVAEDRSSAHGVVYVLDDVLPLPPTLLAFLQSDPAVNSVFALLPNSTLHTLSVTAHLTMFLPTPEALQSLSALEQQYIRGPWPEANQDRLQLFAWHTTSIGLGHGKIGYAQRLREAKNATVTTVLGGEFHVRALDHGAIEAGGARVVRENLLTENGVVHLVDDLHLPYGDLGLTLEKYLLVLGAVRFVRLFHEAGLAHYLNRPPHGMPHDDAPQEAMTIVAPSDDALDRWLDGLRSEPALVIQEHDPSELGMLGEIDMPRVREVLLYHLLRGTILANATAVGDLLVSELHSPRLGGAAQRVPVTPTDRRNKTQWTLGGIAVRTDPVVASNATIYLADDVLVPPGGVVQAVQAASQDAGLYANATVATGYEEQLRTAPSTTYLVPTDTAFQDLGLVTKFWLSATPQARDDLSTLLDYHTLRGIHYAATFEREWTSYKTGTHEMVQVRARDGTIEVRMPHDASVAQVTHADVLTDTGAVHLVDRVHIPLGLSVTPEKLMHAANASRMVRLVRRVGFDWVLDGHPLPNQTHPRAACGERAVLLVPTDAAMEQLNDTDYEEDDEALRALIAQHILLINTCKTGRASRETHSSLRLPLPLKNEAVHASWLDRVQTGKTYGALAFRRVAKPRYDDLGYVIGIKGARGFSGKRHAARVLEFGATHGTRGEAMWTAGILTLDGVLEPYYPVWFFRWGYALLVCILGVITVGVGGVYVYLRVRLRGYRRVPDALEGEEE
ncbi:hypothetical protein CBS9595_001570 [Malassezia furfur]|nr:hypothetical protein CBS9595_001570 [Malassezia furfur]